MVVPLTGTPGHALATSLGGRRVASVYAGDDPAATEVAGPVAAELGLRLTATAALRAAGSGEPATEVVDRHRAQLEEVADLHRGETVLVLADGRALDLVLPQLLGSAPDAVGRFELENDSDGWVLVEAAGNGSD